MLIAQREGWAAWAGMAGERPLAQAPAQGLQSPCSVALTLAHQGGVRMCGALTVSCGGPAFLSFNHQRPTPDTTSLTVTDLLDRLCGYTVKFRVFVPFRNAHRRCIHSTRYFFPVKGAS